MQYGMKQQPSQQPMRQIRPANRWVLVAGSYLTLVVIVARHCGQTIDCGSLEKGAAWMKTVAAGREWLMMSRFKYWFQPTWLLGDDGWLHRNHVGIVVGLIIIIRWRHRHGRISLLLLHRLRWIALLAIDRRIARLTVCRRIRFLVIWIWERFHVNDNPYDIYFTDNVPIIDKKRDRVDCTGWFRFKITTSTVALAETNLTFKPNEKLCVRCR